MVTQPRKKQGDTHWVHVVTRGGVRTRLNVENILYGKIVKEGCSNTSLVLCNVTEAILARCHGSFEGGTCRGTIKTSIYN